MECLRHLQDKMPALSQHLEKLDCDLFILSMPWCERARCRVLVACVFVREGGREGRGVGTGCMRILCAWRITPHERPILRARSQVYVPVCEQNAQSRSQVYVPVCEQNAQSRSQVYVPVCAQPAAGDDCASLGRPLLGRLQGARAHSPAPQISLSITILSNTSAYAPCPPPPPCPVLVAGVFPRGAGGVSAAGGGAARRARRWHRLPHYSGAAGARGARASPGVDVGGGCGAARPCAHMRGSADPFLFFPLSVFPRAQDATTRLHDRDALLDAAFHSVGSLSASRISKYRQARSGLDSRHFRVRVAMGNTLF